MNPTGPIQNPDLRAVLNAHRDEIFASFNCHQVGEIVSFDPELQNATVKINARRVVYNRPQTSNAGLQQEPLLIEYPLLTDVPVFVASGGTARLSMPIAAGDPCLVLFNDRDLDNWWQAGGVQTPNSSRMHNLSDALAIVGFRSKAAPLEDYEADNVVLRLGDSVVRITPDKTIEIAQEGDDPGSLIKLKADGAIEITKQDSTYLKLTVDGAVDLTSKGGARLRLSEDGNVLLEAANGAYLGLGTLATIATTAGSLKTVLDAVVTALTALNSKTGPSAATQIAAVESAIADVIT
jgi:hypothetical protein